MLYCCNIDKISCEKQKYTICYIVACNALSVAAVVGLSIVSLNDNIRIENICTEIAL